MPLTNPEQMLAEDHTPEEMLKALEAALARVNHIAIQIAKHKIEVSYEVLCHDTLPVVSTRLHLIAKKVLL